MRACVLCGSTCFRPASTCEACTLLRVTRRSWCCTPGERSAERAAGCRGAPPDMPGLEFALVALIAFATLAFGGVYPWGYATIAVVGAVLGVWAAAATRS